MVVCICCHTRDVLACCDPSTLVCRCSACGRSCARLRPGLQRRATRARDSVRSVTRLHWSSRPSEGRVDELWCRVPLSQARCAASHDSLCKMGRIRAEHLAASALLAICVRLHGDGRLCDQQRGSLRPCGPVWLCCMLPKPQGLGAVLGPVSDAQRNTLRITVCADVT